MRRLAVISADGLYRYSLTRQWSHNARRLLFVMLNPSTADANVDDPTIRRCVTFAQREDCGALDVVNLYALRSAYPERLAVEEALGVDIVGPANAAALREFAQAAQRIVVAWGAHDAARPARVRETVEILRGRRDDQTGPERELYCLGTTASGAPRHPLYVRRDTPLIPWALP